MTNVNISINELAPIGGTNQSGAKLAYVLSKAKAAQNDTWTLTGAKKVLLVWPTVDADGTSATYTAATNVITLTSATTGAHSALVLYQ